MCGTAGYRAPEVRSENYTVKIDVYSFGMILKAIEHTAI
jgi:serine/threonine protein kinase